jgi:hypothetical protein
MLGLVFVGAAVVYALGLVLLALVADAQAKKESLSSY